MNVLDFKVGDRVRHLYEEGTVVAVNGARMLVHYEHGPSGEFFGPQQLVVARYDETWFNFYPHKLQHAPQPREEHKPDEDVGNALAPVMRQMNRLFNGHAQARDPRKGCLALVWDRDTRNYNVLANGITTPELRVALVDMLTKIDRDMRNGG